MRLLLDSHALVWFCEDCPDLSGTAKFELESPKNQCVFSVASIWELAIKARLGKLKLIRPLDARFRQVLRDHGIEELSIEFPHVVRAAGLPSHHSDPFDRLLVAQAQLEGLEIVSKDHQLDAYGIQRIW